MTNEAAYPYSYLNFANLSFIEELFELYQRAPENVEPTWRYFFQGMEYGEKEGGIREASPDLRIGKLIDAYRQFGHLMAKVNPIAIRPPERPPQLRLETLGFRREELKTSFPTLGLLKEEEAPLEAIITTLEEIYCGTVGIEYMGFQSPELEKWLQEKIEPTRFHPNLSVEQKKMILRQLNSAELFEIFLHTKFVGQKRFSLEGGETLIPILAELIEKGSDVGMDELVIGMAHRGRLNVLTNIMKKSYSMVFDEFEDHYEPSWPEGLGDVKYHKGFSSDVTTLSGKKIHIGLTPNPSHLESVDPIVEGKTRAKQKQRQDLQRKKVVPLLIHGDAALAGQGVVYETMQLYRLEGYGVGGTVHAVINNQIGFTTLPKDSRSTPYCTDIARAFESPVFHVNAEDPEGCVYATQLATELRQRFQCDVFIDLNCYRKYGHNEGDEPAFSQPLEYKIIRNKKSIREIYRDYLIQQGVVEKEIALELEQEFNKDLHFELEQLKLRKEVIPEEAFGGVWKKYRRGAEKDLFQPVETAVSAALLREIAENVCKIPEGFHIHPKVGKLFQERLKMLQEGHKKKIDWAMSELLAFGSLLWEGTPIRLTGQDIRRGTFSQRHAVLVDQENNAKYYPLAHLKEDQGTFEAYDSSLSEYAALGYEYGYSLSYPSALVLWEAQYGDFANGAQIMIDQYIAVSEQKWQRFSGLVMLLPHGYEGQGPEHSSARLERFLQLAGSANMQIVYPTTPAQYFHLLRRQVNRLIRKPLIVFTPKALLRHPECVSSLDELSSGTFQEILDDPEKKEAPSRLILCSGRVFYDLIAERRKRQKEDVAILRIEQLYPLNLDKFNEFLRAYSSIKEAFWVQEEPRNMGAWEFIRPVLQEVFPKKVALHYVGRSRSASPATGSHAMHEREKAQIMQMAFE